MAAENVPRIGRLEKRKKLVGFLVSAGQEHHLLIELNVRKNLVRQRLKMSSLLQFCQLRQRHRYKRYIDISLERILNRLSRIGTDEKHLPRLGPGAGML